MVAVGIAHRRRSSAAHSVVARLRGLHARDLEPPLQILIGRQSMARKGTVPSGSGAAMALKSLRSFKQWSDRAGIFLGVDDAMS